MKKIKEKRKTMIKTISMGNLKDLILPFLCQVKLVRNPEDVESIFIDPSFFEDFEETKDLGFLYRIEIYYKKGGVNNSKELQKGDAV